MRAGSRWAVGTPVFGCATRQAGRGHGLQSVESRVIARELRIAAPPSKVYAFFTEPQFFVRWLGERVRLEPRPGGAFRVRLDDANVVSGVYVEVAPGRRVSFTWGWDGSDIVPPGTSLVDVTFEPDGDGTLLHFAHTRLPECAVKLHELGWQRFLSRLPDVVATSTL
jgi:uncharacterized protein YndB with AHSA1/START domain